VARKISVNDAVLKLRPAFGPRGAVNEMNAAMLRDDDDKRVRLFCDGHEVDPNFIETHLKVQLARRGSSAEIVAKRALDKPVEAYRWGVDASEIEALLGPARARVEPQPAAAEPEPPVEAPQSEEPPIYGVIRQFADEEWPQGWAYVDTSQIMKKVGEKFEGRGWPVPHRDRFLRALGRRKG
jgi:hypothetical protein